MRALIGFWIAAFALSSVAAGVLQFLGAPDRASPSPVARTEPPAPAAQEAAAQGATALPRRAAAVLPGPRPTWDGRIAPPDPALLEPSRLVPNALLPRTAPDGRAPMHVYARPFEAADPRPRISLLVAGLGMSEAESRAAVESLPGPVSFAVSAYGEKLEPLLQAARDRGHELLVSLPMEPSGYPMNNAGVRSLQTGADQETNQRNLEAVLGRVAGYVGVTGASDGMRGERFVQIATSFRRVADELSDRGLLYIDARPPAPGTVPLNAPGLPTRSVDVVIDDPGSRAEIEAKLAQLERVARDRGSALGLASALRPVTLDRLAAWARTVEMRGFVLAPVSALVPDPASPGRPR